MSFSVQSVIMAVALLPDQGTFDNISLVKIVARFIEDHQGCIGGAESRYC